MVLLLEATSLVRLVSEICEQANQRLPKKLAELPDRWQTASCPAFIETLERYIRLRNLEFSRWNFTGLPAINLRNLARYAAMASAKFIARMPKLAILITFVTAQDEAVDVLDMLILDITREAKKTGQKKRLRTLRDLEHAALLLARVSSLLLDEQAKVAELSRAIFSSVPKSRLAKSISKVNELAHGLRTTTSMMK